MTTVNSYDILAHSAFSAVRAAVFDSFVCRLGLSSIDDIDHVRHSVLTSSASDLRDDRELCNFIDNKIRIVLSDLGYKYDFIQFPVNIRILNPVLDTAYKRKEYNVDTIHCDHWSGSPLDSTNAYMYLRKRITSPELAFYSVSAADQSLIDSYLGPYRNSPKVGYERLNLDSAEGILHLFSCRVPHQIIRNTEGVTISIDFRLRNKTTLFDHDLTCKSSEQWMSSRITSLGVYWKWLDSYPDSFSDRIRHELSESFTIGDMYWRMRSNFINEHYR